MLTNKTFFLTKLVYFWVFLSFPIAISAQVSTSLNQSFNIDAAQSISINVNSPNLKVKYIKGTRILVETTISLSIDNSALLHFIAQKGRYDLTKELDATTKCLKLVPKNKQDLILVKGKKLQENVSYTIYIPEEIAFVDLANK